MSKSKKFLSNTEETQLKNVRCLSCQISLENAIKKGLQIIADDPSHMVCSKCLNKSEKTEQSEKQPSKSKKTIATSKPLKLVNIQDPYQSNDRILNSMEDDDFFTHSIDGMSLFRDGIKFQKNQIVAQKQIQTPQSSQKKIPDACCQICKVPQKSTDSPLLRGGKKPHLLYTQCGREQHRKICAPCFLKTYECPFCKFKEQKQTKNIEGKLQDNEKQQQDKQSISTTQIEQEQEQLPEEVYIFRVFAPTGVSLKQRRRSEEICAKRMSQMMLNTKQVAARRKKANKKSRDLQNLKMKVFLIWVPVLLFLITLLGYYLVQNQMNSCQFWGGYNQCLYKSISQKTGNLQINSSPQKHIIIKMCCPPQNNLSCPKNSLHSNCRIKQEYISQKSFMGWLKGFLGFTLMILGAWIGGGVWVIKKILSRSQNKKQQIIENTDE